MTGFTKSIEELEDRAVLWWPESLKKETSDISVIPLLLDTQEGFISILRLCKSAPLQVFDLIEAAQFPANLFLSILWCWLIMAGKLSSGSTRIFTRFLRI